MTKASRFLCLFALLCLLGAITAEICDADEKGKAGSTKPATTNSTKDERPWLILTGRPAIGTATINAVNLYWQTESGHEVDVNEMNNVIQGAFIPEAFFMPTKKRGLILSASLPFGVGMGTMNPSGVLTEANRPATGKGTSLKAGDEIFQEGARANYTYLLFNGGIGYQFYFGQKDRTSLFLLTHLGGGPAWFDVECLDSTAKTGPMTAIDVDGSIGMHYRLKNNMILGASLDGWLFFFRGDFQSGGPIDLPVDVLLGGVSLNAMIGYAFF